MRVWIVEDHQLFCELLIDYLKAAAHVEVVGTSVDQAPLFRELGTREIDVVVLDLNLQGAGGMRVLEELGKLPKAPQVVILSATATEHSVNLAVRLGARAYIDKGASLNELLLAFEQIAQGGVYFSDLPRRVLIDLAARRGRVEEDKVTVRETEVLARLARGEAIKEVAGDIGVSKWAVYRIRNELRRKLELADDKELIEYALKIGLAEGPADHAP